MDHFARLGLPAALDLDAAAVDKAYFAGQRQWHPDRFVGKPAEQRAKASVEAAGLNDAYRTLKDPLARAFYLAELNGVELPGDGKTIDEAETIKNTDIAKHLALPPVKIHCSVLAEDAIKAAIADYRAKTAKKDETKDAAE